jgi:hypothetical protein
LEGTYYTVSRRTCINGGYTIQDLNFNSVMNLRVGQCYKDIIQCFFNYDNWHGKSALWLQECQLSPATQTTLFSFYYNQPNDGKNYIKKLGDGTDTPDGCWPGIFWTQGANPNGLASTLHHNAMMYIIEAADSLYQRELAKDATVEEEVLVEDSLL